MAVGVGSGLLLKVKQKAGQKQVPLGQYWLI